MACKHINNTKEHYQITREQMNKKGTENFQKKKKTQKIIHKMVTCTYLSIVTLNVSRLYALIKGYRMAE